MQLRIAGGYERQLDLARAGNIERVDVNRVETGKNRFLSESLQTRYAKVFGVPVETMIGYARGTIPLEDIRRHWSPKAAPATFESPSKALDLAGDPFPNRAAAIELLLPKFPAAVLNSLRRMSFKGGEDLEVPDFVAKAKELLRLYQSADVELEDDDEAEAMRLHPDPHAPPTLAQIAEHAAHLPPRKTATKA